MDLKRYCILTFGQRSRGPAIKFRPPDVYERSWTRTVHERSRSSRARNATSTHMCMRRSRSSWSAASGGSLRHACNCRAHRMRRCKLSCSLSERPVDVGSPTTQQSVLALLCVSHLCKPLADRKIRGCPCAIGYWQVISQRRLTSCQPEHSSQQLRRRARDQHQPVS